MLRLRFLHFPYSAVISLSTSPPSQTFPPDAARLPCFSRFRPPSCVMPHLPSVAGFHAPPHPSPPPNRRIHPVIPPTYTLPPTLIPNTQFTSYTILPLTPPLPEWSSILPTRLSQPQLFRTHLVHTFRALTSPAFARHHSQLALTRTTAAYAVVTQGWLRHTLNACTYLLYTHPSDTQPSHAHTLLVAPQKSHDPLPHTLLHQKASYTHTHSRTHTIIHTRTHTHTHLHKHTRPRTHTTTHLDTRTSTHTRTHTSPHTQTHLDTRTHLHTHASPHAHKHPHTHIHTHTSTHTHPHAHIHTHTSTRTHPRARTSTVYSSRCRLLLKGALPTRAS